MMRFEQCRSIASMNEGYGYGTARVFEVCDVIPLAVDACDETVFALGMLLSSMDGGFGFSEDVGAVVLDNLLVETVKIRVDKES